MNMLMSNGLSTCGCCEGVTQLTPATIANRPGLSTLAYRVGIHATFLETMLARLSNMGIPLGELNTILDDPGKADELLYPLNALMTRATDDPSIALLDAWAILAGVLSFYQERIANEGYLRTATERRSLIELARLVNYTLRPGVAASVFLSYTLENGRVTTIPKGSRAQSIPGPGQLPQSFETSFDIEARADWNAIQPRMSVPQYITQIDPTRFTNVTFDPMIIDTDTADGALYLDGTSTQLKPNDVLLFAFGNETGQQVFSHTLKIEPNAAQKYTRVTFPPVFTALVYSRRLLNIVERYLDFSLFDISPNDPVVLAVVPSLQEQLKDARTLLGLDSGSGTGGIGMQGPIHLSLSTSILSSQQKSSGTLIDDILTWNENYSQAVSTQDDKVAGWLGALITDMKTLLLTVDPGADLNGLVNPVVTTSISTLVTPLAKPSSLQPVNGTRLQRSVHGEFSRKSDIALQMLSTLNQAVQSTLLTAVSNASVTSGATLQNLYAMRVKAAPFGSNAPKQAVPVYSGNQITGTDYQEWHLTDTVTLYLQLNPYTAGDTQITGTVSLSENDTQVDQNNNYTLTIPQDPKEPLSGHNAPFKIHVTAGSGTPPPLGAVVIETAIQIVTLTFTDGEWRVAVDGGDRLHTVSILDNDGSVNVSITVSMAPPDILDLDARYDQIVPNSPVVIEYGDGNTTPPLITMATSVQSLSRADYGMSSKITRLVLAQPWLTGNETLLSDIRNVTIYAQSEELKPAEEPLTDDIQGDIIELDNFYDGLKSGQWAVVSGERTDIVNTSGVATSELVMIASVEQDVRQTNTPPPASTGGSGGSNKPGALPPPQSDLPNDTTHTFLHFAQPLAYTYKRATVEVNANVVKATQGETRIEVLGSGDGSAAMQQFTLKQSPLTYVSAPTPAGAESTLQVYVNDVQWHAVESLDAQGSKAHVFITKTDDTDKTTLTFGNGQQHGARPPTGVENIKALYRTGIGTPGNVEAGQISMLATRPLGVKGVMNPKPATGGADRESISQARRNVPLATQALSRIVSVQDYADFARTFAGIGKANVLTLPTINRQLVHLTIAGLDNIPIDPTSDLYQNLFLALRTFGNPSEPLQVDVCETKLLVLSLRVRILPDYRLETVSPAIRAALLNAFSFEQRDLGQPVYESEVFNVAQQVPGVAFVDLDILDAVDQPKLLNALDVIHQQELQAAVNGVQPNETQDLVKLLNLQVRQVVPSLLARTVRNQPGVILPAQLVFLSSDVPDTLIINELTSTHIALKSKKRR
jgi:predicted phage baseplate assembly protein